MRKGKNLSKDILLPVSDSNHRIIIPLYIPEEDGYYKDAFTIFTYCLTSIHKTSFSNIKISVISNGSCNSVNTKLFQLQEEKYIDELIIEKENIGKVNSILKALRTAEERLITITDADVLFDNNWEKEVLEVFNAFPKAGSVSPVPVFRNHFRLTSNIWFDNLFSQKLKFRPVKDPESMTLFANSIGWPWLDIKYKDVIATLKNKQGAIAVLGSSHFVCTYKKEVFSKMPKSNSIYKLGGDSEYLYTDLPVLKMGGYRLATYGNYAFHLGNVLEDWMIQKMDTLKVENKEAKIFKNLKTIKARPLYYFFTEKVFKKIFYNSIIRNKILTYKGLSKEQINNL
ncbi:glycosyltransferase family A protein [Flavobacterium sp. MMLR14_040]|uniref:glycosyltransferase family A protein n=1 Tax=Flavobacterium sp. MMLR14_040 TaxID=3093843 RepID=UPI00298FC5BC|nr:glycosyltransferase family A protein [Flavobacterium sp. MMLR14_040]MDW8849243.1 glycosyltransferase family A protein [Flavobacterium sp. MMLR14_040]